MHRDLIAVSVFLVNARPEAVRRFADVAFAFQVRLELTAPAGFAPRDDRASYDAGEFDARLADLHYRGVSSCAVGHNTSSGWAEPDAEGRVTRVFTDPIPVQEVEKLGADLDVPGVERGMKALAEAALDPRALAAALAALPADYARWAAGQAAAADALDGARRREVARECLANVEAARARIAGGVGHLLADPLSREAFAVANRVMARANVRRAVAQNGQPPKRAPSWRLFQLAFVLLNLEGLASPAHPDRRIVDLLFFPTGGGKTEAYLGLAAFAIARRRLADPGLAGAGLSVVMRYMLRLLTLDQLQRAAGLVCALELERQEKGRLGTSPIEIGLWVGGGATPNSFGSSKSPKEGTAVRWLQEHRKGGPAPAPVKDCPWCGTPLRMDGFHIHPNVATPQRLDITCDGLERGCPFTGKQRLPIVVVDDEIYGRLPASMIATVDKFAGVPWEGRSGAVFGNVGRADEQGFYGAEDRTAGRPLKAELRPIDLVIRDELHLISGPLGTVAGLYETALDLLSSRQVNGERRGPKIVTSTATVRRADAQIRNLFGRDRTVIFPPPGVGRDDSFFATVDRDTPSRLYAGIASPGRGPKLVFLRTLQTLLAGAQALSTGAKDDPADPYLTALCYFNALREHGGARRIVDDEMRTHLSSPPRWRSCGSARTIRSAPNTARTATTTTGRCMVPPAMPACSSRKRPARPQHAPGSEPARPNRGPGDVAAVFRTRSGLRRLARVACFDHGARHADRRECVSISSLGVRPRRSTRAGHAERA